MPEISWIDIVLLTIVAAGLLYSAASLVVFGRSRRRQPAQLLTASHLPPVSVLKPLKGIDEQLEANLRSFFEIRYPVFELVFCVNDLDDPAIELVRRLQAEYPTVPSSLVVDTYRCGLNPKVSNLINAYPTAKHDLVMIADSNIAVRSDYLHRLVSERELSNAGLVVATIRGSGEESFGALLENLHINAFVAPQVEAVRHFFGRTLAIGKSFLFSRDTMERIGGLRAYRNLLAEDHQMAVAIKKLGRPIHLSAYQIDNVNRQISIRQFLSRHLRWAMLRRWTNFSDYLLEIFSFTIIYALTLAVLRLDLFGVAVVAITWIVRALLDTIALRQIGASQSAATTLVTPIKEMILFVVWWIPLFRRTVFWRGHRFIIGPRTVLKPVATADSRTHGEEAVRHERGWRSFGRRLRTRLSTRSSLSAS